MEDLEADTPRDATLIEKQAVAWFTRMNGRPSRADRRHFEEWLAADPAHGKIYEGLRNLWSGLGPSAETVARLDADELAEPLRIIAQSRRSKGSTKTTVALTSFLAMLVVGSWLWLVHPNFLQDLRADYVTAKAERREISLPDGSTVLLDADSALVEAMTGTERRVRLLRGTAAFSVLPSSIPFLVDAEGGEARVLGTQFDVAVHREGNVTVTLASGSVQVALPGRHDGVVLTPGESVDYDEVGLGSPQTVNLEEATAWRNGRFIFTDARLADVLGRLEQYRDGRIVLIGSSLGEKRVSGNISLADADAALAAVQASVGFRVTSLGRRVTVVSP